MSKVMMPKLFPEGVDAADVVDEVKQAITTLAGNIAELSVPVPEGVAKAHLNVLRVWRAERMVHLRGDHIRISSHIVTLYRCGRLSPEAAVQLMELLDELSKALA